MVSKDTLNAVKTLMSNKYSELLVADALTGDDIYSFSPNYIILGIIDIFIFTDSIEVAISIEEKYINEYDSIIAWLINHDIQFFINEYGHDNKLCNMINIPDMPSIQQLIEFLDFIIPMTSKMNVLF